MKSLSWAVLGLLLCVPFAGAEVIDSVSFNPARLGRYETLKVSDQLTTKGGIEANAVTVQSGGTVSVNNAGNYKFPVTEVLGSVDMKSTDFEAVTLNSRGTASFENKSSSAESKITTLNTSTADVRANILDLTSVTVPDEDENSLRLGENDIPRPASVGLDNCSNLTWVERTTDDNYKYKVLAFGSCKGEEPEKPATKCIATITTAGSTNFSGLTQANSADTCDGNARQALSFKYGDEVDDSWCEKAACTDYYNYSGGTTVQKGKWVNAGLESSFTYNSNLDVCSSSDISYRNACSSRLKSQLTGATTIMSAAQACDIHCNSLSGTPSGTHKCNASCEINWCVFINGAWGCTKCGAGVQRCYDCDHLELQCYTSTDDNAKATYAKWSFKRS